MGNESIRHQDFLELLLVEYIFTTPANVDVQNIPGKASGAAAVVANLGDVSCSCSEECLVSCNVLAFSNILMNTNNRLTRSHYDNVLRHEKRHVMSWAYKIKIDMVGNLVNEAFVFESMNECEGHANDYTKKYRRIMNSLALGADHEVDEGETKYSPTAKLPVGEAGMEGLIPQWKRDMEIGKIPGSAYPWGQILFDRTK